MIKRKQMGMGFTCFKMDLYSELVADKPVVIHKNGMATQKGLDNLCEHKQAVRDAIGRDVPLAADHFGPLSVDNSIR